MKSPWRAGRDIDTLIENIELLTGQRGDGSHKATTAAELARLRLATPVKGISGRYTLKPGLMQPLTSNIDDLEAQFKPQPPQPPTKPSGLIVTGAFSSVLLEWRYPDYRGHNYTEIWRAEEDELADATLIGTTAGQVYSDPVNPGFTGYYWIRFVNTASVKGSYNATSGTPAETIDVDAFFDKVESQISRSPFISGINEKGTKAFLDMWQKKTSAAGIKAGIGLVAGKDSHGNPVSQVAIAAKQFFVYDPDKPATQVYPFIVSGNQVLINSLIARDAIIQTIKSQRIIADEIRAGVSISSPTITSASISNGKFTVDWRGNMTANDATMNNLTARTFKAYDFRADGGELNNVWIHENCRIDGTLSAAHIEGDVATVGVASGSPYLKPMPFSRTVMLFHESKGNPKDRGLRNLERYDTSRIALREDRKNDNMWTWVSLFRVPAYTPVTLDFGIGALFYITFKD